jgi:hypothetical protein
VADDVRGAVAFLSAQAGVWGVGVFVVWMTCVLDGREHAVREEEFAAGTAHGRYRAACQRLLAPRALTAPPGTRCLICAATIREHNRGERSGRHATRRRRWPRWLAGRA